MTFEEKLDKLNKILEEMKSNNIPLQDMVSYYEEGKKLIKELKRELNEVQEKIEIIE